jgi:hypothetical protein
LLQPSAFTHNMAGVDSAATGHAGRWREAALEVVRQMLVDGGGRGGARAVLIISVSASSGFEPLV